MTYQSDAAAWSVTNVGDKKIVVPKMINSPHYGISFALDFIDNSLPYGARIDKVFTIDHQPAVI